MSRPEGVTMFKSRKSAALTLAEYDAKVEADRKLDRDYEVIARIERAAESHAWDDPKNWK